VKIAQPQNQRIIEYLTRGGGYFLKKSYDSPAFAPWDSVPDPYSGCGCHPDIVEYLWDRIGKALPADCRGLVYGTPGLVQPKSGVILALGNGTSYGLRLPRALISQAIKEGAKMIMHWSDGGLTDAQKEYGDDWLFGSFSQNDPIWCKQVYEVFDHLA